MNESLLDIFISAFYLTLPLVIAGALHMAVVKFKILPFLAKPVNAKLFGTHKTWRGLIVMPLLAILGLFIVRPLETFFGEHILMSLTSVPEGAPLMLLGLALGLGYTLPELPNSWVKRRMGVPEGKLPKENRLLFFVLDHFDSTLGCAFVYFAALPGPAAVPIGVLFLGPIIHTAISILLWALGLRKEPV